MAKRLSKLTSTQHEILAAVWAHPAGATVTEIWDRISASRQVTRTTVLNLVDRLEKRGWLKRQRQADGFRYRATVDRETTARMVATEFADDFFSGSASQLMASLLGGKRLEPAEADRLRQLLDAAAKNKSKK